MYSDWRALWKLCTFSSFSPLPYQDVLSASLKPYHFQKSFFELFQFFFFFFFTPLCSAAVISLVSGPFGCCHYSVSKSCLPLCNPTYYSMSGSSVLHFWSLLRFMSTELVMLSNHLILCRPLLLLPSIFPASGSFPVSWPFTSDGQSIGASALVLPMSIQGWFSLRLTGLISLLSKGLSRGFSSTTIGKHQFFSTQPSL